MLRRASPCRNYSSCLTAPQGARYFLSLRATCLDLVRAVSALLNDISPDLLPLRPIFSRISPRISPLLAPMILSNSSRLEPRQAPNERRPRVCRGPCPHVKLGEHLVQFVKSRLKCPPLDYDLLS